MGVLTRKFIPEQDSELFDPETGNCSIEYYNACKDPYRATSSNKVLAEFPWYNNRVSEAASLLYDQIEDNIQKVLSDYKIPGAASIYRYAARTTPEDSKDIIVLRPHNDSNILSWRKVASQIYDEIVKPAATSAQIEVGVEIRNDKKMYAELSHFIEDEAVIRSIARIQPFVLGAVLEHCHGKWTSIAYHNRSHFDYGSEMKVTALIFIRSGAIHAWAELEEKIVGTIQSAGFPADIDISVEVLPGQLALRTQSFYANARSYYHQLPTVPTNGSSIAPSNCTDAAGTFGPVVNFRAAGEEEAKKYVLTCYNVIASGDPAGKEINDSRGIGINGREVGARIDVDYLAKYDSAALMRQQTRLIKSCDSKHAAKLIKSLDEIATHGSLGQVKFASGYRVTPTNYRMDWALIELNPALPVKNHLPTDRELQAECCHGSPEYISAEGATVTGTSTSLRSKWYGKVGRTSQGSGGERGPIKRAIAWDDGSISHEYEFKCLDSYKPFAQLGDAGSLVFNLEKEWAGLLIAADRSSGIGYVTPVYELLRDIEEVTGGTNTLV
ncbi:hypothetical protein V493_07949 [Pseudogymnoascus sp. VKM F-4281 (FW-2241)]|nr:hypothetical protein V493_07949 [Pseudogymnoascus sp. VKM F-4281 (FW-2241)]